MKKNIVFLLTSVVFSFAAMAQAEERDYVAAQDLVITDQGIFLRDGADVVPMDSISYDYSTGQFYASSREEMVILIPCPKCGMNTLSPRWGICHNPKCNYFLPR